MTKLQVVSERRLRANRQNALRSTGPKTVAGKARSRRNALKHGLAACALRSRESLAAVAGLSAAIAKDIAHPIGPLLALAFAEAEVALTEVMQVRALRASDLEARDSIDSAVLDQILKLDRYERRAGAKAKRTLRQVASLQRLIWQNEPKSESLGFSKR